MCPCKWNELVLPTFLENKSVDLPGGSKPRKNPFSHPFRHSAENILHGFTLFAATLKLKDLEECLPTVQNFCAGQKQSFSLKILGQIIDRMLEQNPGVLYSSVALKIEILPLDGMVCGHDQHMIGINNVMNQSVRWRQAEEERRPLCTIIFLKVKTTENVNSWLEAT